MDELTRQDTSNTIGRMHFDLITPTWLSRLHYPKINDIAEVISW